MNYQSSPSCSRNVPCSLIYVSGNWLLLYSISFISHHVLVLCYYILGYISFPIFFPSTRVRKRYRREELLACSGNVMYGRKGPKFNARAFLHAGREASAQLVFVFMQVILMERGRVHEWYGVFLKCLGAAGLVGSLIRNWVPVNLFFFSEVEGCCPSSYH